MKKQWLVPLLLAVAVGAAGFGITGEKAQKVQKISTEAGAAGNIGCETMALNPLRCNAYPEITGAVRTYYAQKEKEEDFIEAYDDILVYTKLGRYAGSYVAYAAYKMKIKDIYTKVPGLAAFYVEKSDSGGYEIRQDVSEEGLKAYASILSTHEDVQALLRQSDEEYEKAVNSDALLREALQDLKDAYEKQTGSSRSQ